MIKKIKDLTDEEVSQICSYNQRCTLLTEENSCNVCELKKVCPHCMTLNYFLSQLKNNKFMLAEFNKEVTLYPEEEILPF
jgi:hypothetical protein